MKEKVKEFVKQCDIQSNNIRDIIANKSLREKIELKAHLKEQVVHSEKTNIIIFEGSICVAILSTKVMFCAIFLVVAVIWCCAIQNKKAKYTKALSYLEDCFEEQSNVASFKKATTNLQIETFEQTRERYTREIEQKIMELNEKRTEIDMQMGMYETVLNELHKHKEL